MPMINPSGLIKAADTSKSCKEDKDKGVGISNAFLLTIHIIADL